MTTQICRILAETGIEDLKFECKWCGGKDCNLVGVEFEIHCEMVGFKRVEVLKIMMNLTRVEIKKVVLIQFLF